MSQRIIVGLLLVVAVALGVYAYMDHRPPASTDQPVTKTPDMSTGTTEVQIALLDTTGEGAGKRVGCDSLTMVKRTVPKTTAVLGAAMQALFAEPEGAQPSSAYNFIARTAGTLKYDHATVEAGTASIYLTGSLSGFAGVCDDPRAANQITETALQFPTVQKVQLYLNGKASTLMPPSEKGE